MDRTKHLRLLQIAYCLVVVGAFLVAAVTDPKMALAAGQATPCSAAGWGDPLNSAIRWQGSVPVNGSIAMAPRTGLVVECR